VRPCWTVFDLVPVGAAPEGRERLSSRLAGQVWEVRSLLAETFDILRDPPVPGVTLLNRVIDLPDDDRRAPVARRR
jgi:hypothetical protein